MTATVDNGTVHAALELAGRAPSVHNTQWSRWRIGRAAIHLYAGTERWLPATDPDGRDLLVSCGAWRQNLRMALTASDIGVTADRLPDPDEPDLLAVVALRSKAEGVDRALASEQVVAMGVRRSDRGRVGWPPATGPAPPRTARLSSRYEVEDRPSDRLPTDRVRSAP